jgi:hypothetical protein
MIMIRCFNGGGAGSSGQKYIRRDELPHSSHQPQADTAAHNFTNSAHLENLLTEPSSSLSLNHPPTATPPRNTFSTMKSSFILAAIYGIVNAAADPLPDWEITPGPGMPSLEAVGLSKEKLHKMSLEEMANPGTHIKARAISRIERSPLLGRQVSQKLCSPDEPAETSCALWCLLYLNDLGNTPCVVKDSALHSNWWCTSRRPGSNGAKIYGVFPIRRSTSIPCRDVADELSWVAHNAACHFNGQCGESYPCLGGSVIKRDLRLTIRGKAKAGELKDKCVEGVTDTKCVL